MKNHSAIIGRFEHIDLVGRLEAIPAKIDTGAYRSSIHASKIRITTKKGKQILQFNILGHPAYSKSVPAETSVFRLRDVRSSNGQVATRYEVSLKLQLGGKTFITPFTLTDRASNVFPILIGRKALNKRFIIDSDQTGINRNELRKAAKIATNKEDLEGVNT